MYALNITILLVNYSLIKLEKITNSYLFIFVSHRSARK